MNPVQPKYLYGRSADSELKVPITVLKILLLYAVPILTAHHRLPAGSVDDALPRSDIITMAGPSVGLSHGQMAVGVRHGQPPEHGVVWSLPQSPLVLPLDSGPRLLIHLGIASPTAAVNVL